jgi:UDP-3-O-[3-hydroxymyristoyl] glucosamine N-acyltransferase
MQIPATTLKAISEIIKAAYVGDPGHLVTGFNEIHRVEAGDAVFVDHPKYYDKALQSAATTIIINKKTDCPEGKALLIVEEPFTAFNILTQHFQPKQYSSQPISPSAAIGKGTIIMPGCFIGNHVTIGNNCILHPNVVVYDNCVIGNDVVIQAGTIIGSDAFYFKNRKTHFEQLQTCGNVVIKDQVKIGAGCTVDKGVSSDTLIGKGTIIDNLVHIGHDVVIGEMCLFAASVGIAGCCTIGDHVTLWGQVGIASDIRIGNNAVVQAQSGVGENINEGSICTEAIALAYS